MVDRSLIERIEKAALWAWPPKETACQDGWLLRAGDGHTRRINSARTLHFASAADLHRAIRRTQSWYAARGLPACFQLTALSAPAGLEAELERRGYARLPSVQVLTVDPATIELPGPEPVEIETRPTPLAMNAVCDPRWGPMIRRARAELFARIRRPHVFAVLTEGGQPAAGGLCVVDGPLAGVFTMRTEVPFRRRGYAGAVFRRLVDWARRHGAAQVYLQVEDDNEAALALYRPHGGERVYGYWYREEQPGEG